MAQFVENGVVDEVSGYALNVDSTGEADVDDIIEEKSNNCLRLLHSLTLKIFQKTQLSLEGKLGQMIRWIRTTRQMLKIYWEWK